MRRNQVNTECMKGKSWKRRFLPWTSDVLPFWFLRLLPDTGLLYWMASQSQNRFSAFRFSLQPISSIPLHPSPNLLPTLFFCFQLGASSGKAICLAPFHLTLSTMYIYRALYIINGDSNSLEHSFNSRNPWSLNVKQWSIYAYLVTLLCPPKDLKRICWMCTV